MRLRPALFVPLLVAAACSGPSAPTHPSSAAPPAQQPHAGAAATSYADWPTYHGNRARTGYAADVPAVTGTPRVVASVRLDGAVYASPLVVGGHTIVATENDSVYAFTSGGHQLWRRHLGTPSPQSQRPCGDIDPLGITGTPVYSPATKLIYVAAEQSGNPPRHVLFALSTDGTVRWHRSLDLPGVDPAAMQQRGALTIEGQGVWTPFGGLAGDCGDYKGRLVRIRLDGGDSPIQYTVPTAREAGMWTPPGPSVDAHGYLYQSVGNGASVAGDPYDYSDSVLKLDGLGHLVDHFSPVTWASDNAGDRDLGSQGATLVGGWVFIAGKSGTAYVLRQGRLGGIGGQVSEAQVCTSFGGTAVVGSTVYVPCTDGVRAVSIDAGGQLHVKWHSASSITGSPVVGGGRLWTLDTGAGVLHALDPRTGASTASVEVGAVNRFATPALYGRLVLVGTLSGYVVVETG